MTGEVNTWVAAGAGNWGDDANWSLGHVPTATETATFDNTSDNNCAVNAAPDVLGISLASGYDGTVTQGAVDITLGTDGYAQAAGTFTAAVAKTVTCAGDFTKTGGTMTAAVSNFIFTTDGSTISGGAFKLIRASANISVVSAVTSGGIMVDLNKTLAIASGQTLTLYTTTTITISNSGVVAGPGTLLITPRGADFTFAFGIINASLSIAAHASAGANRIITLGANASLGSALAVSSSHASNTMTLDCAGHNLTASSITFGTRGVLTNSGASAACSCSGAFTISGASSVVSGAIVLTYGTYVQSNGTSTQVGNWSGGDLTASAGTLTGAGSASVTVTSSGDVNLTGATVTADKLNLVMTGAGKSLTAQNILLHSLDISGSVSATVNDWWGIADEGLFHVSGALSLPGTSNVLYAYCPTRIVISGILAGTGALAIVYNNTASGILSRIWNAGISAEIRIRSSDEKVSTLGSNLLTGGKLLVENSGGASMTLDAAGYNIDCSTIVWGTGGIILGGEGVHHIGGAFNSSAGTWTPETCQVVFTKAATITCAAASKTFYDLIGYASPITLGADVVVSNIFAHVGPLVPGAFALTMTDPTKEYTSMRRPILRNLRTPIGLPPCCRPLLEGIERVST